ncbi:O-antigen ligase family protein [Lutibacter sp.]|uniref:O-antigen ligase family protein n=1 Tax=Lutibacter sp. TaxID=1925666 RepID=UPI0025BD0DC6|nr:O-antigen ligase family protein [Lutibacter sp.]MCF6169275.1 O-antigen ligase family protein [Lutibacter sp.]
MNFIFYGILIKILINPSIVSLGAFVSHVRLIPSESVFLLLLPALYFFNNYILEYKKLALLKFIILIFLIIYFQHRSVWTASFAAFALNLFILIRQNALNFKKVLPYILIFSFTFLVIFSLVATKSPEVVKKINQDVNNILNPQEDSTGSWRIMQFEAYWPFVTKHIVEGMRLKGFELPVQFFSSENGSQLFKSNTGHHFHSYYIDTLFYFGLIVLIVTLIVILIPIIKIVVNDIVWFFNFYLEFRFRF